MDEFYICLDEHIKDHILKHMPNSSYLLSLHRGEHIKYYSKELNSDVYFTLAGLLLDTANDTTHFKIRLEMSDDPPESLSEENVCSILYEIFGERFELHFYHYNSKKMQKNRMNIVWISAFLT